jgi:hypothetical protein
MPVLPHRHTRWIHYNCGIEILTDAVHGIPVILDNKKLQKKHHLKAIYGFNGTIITQKYVKDMKCD